LWNTIYGNSDLKSTVIVPNDLAWHHIAVVMTNFAQAKFYLDGGPGQTVNRTVTTLASTSGITNLLVGVETDALYFRGLLDRVRISDSALSVEELDAVAVPRPKLLIQQNGTSMTVTWPASFSDYTLESGETVDAANWTVESATLEEDHYTANLPVTTATRFYRLRK